MLVRAMKVVDATRHPHADSLWIYRLEAPGSAALQVVANSERTYAAGDCVVVAQVGVELLDGTKISKARLRGVDSFGMLLGLHDGSPGQDVTKAYAKVPVDVNLPCITWASIEGMHHIRHGFTAAECEGGLRSPRVTYRAKVKLHGTNAGVQVLASGEIAAQGRTQVLSLDQDNAGFAAWVQSHRAVFASARREVDIVIFGEWCGPGIQKGVAITEIARKVFAVFAVQLHTGHATTAQLVIEPDKIRELVPEHPDIFVLPWHGDEVELDWADPDQLAAAAEVFNAWVAEVEARDPWVAEVFGVDGTGEGVVLYPVRIHGRDDYDAGAPVDRQVCSELMWKAKGDRHKVVRQKKPAQVDPEVAKGVDAFVDMVLTEARLEQALTEGCGGDRSPSNTGAFLAWVSRDVQKESVVELEASGLAWKQVSKALTTRARAWFLSK